MREMTKRERLLACIEGRDVDRPPVSLWRHWPVDDQTPEGLAWATIHFQKQFDFDFVKVTPSSSFCLRDWDARDVWEGHYHGTRSYGKPVIRSADDWYKIKPCESNEGALGAQLEALRQIRQGLDPAVPIIQTIFSPLTQCKNLAGPDQLLAHIRQAPDAVMAGLAVIAETTHTFIRAAKGCAIDGIFFAVQHAQAHQLTRAEYNEFGRTFDFNILNDASDLWLNVLHLHGTNVYFDLVADFPVQIINWHDRETKPSLAEGLEKFHGAVCGGIRQEETLLYGTPKDVRREVFDAIEQTSGSRLVVGTGCVTPITSPVGNIRAARLAVEEI